MELNFIYLLGWCLRVSFFKEIQACFGANCSNKAAGYPAGLGSTSPPNRPKAFSFADFLILCTGGYLVLASIIMTPPASKGRYFPDPSKNGPILCKLFLCDGNWYKAIVCLSGINDCDLNCASSCPMEYGRP